MDHVHQVNLAITSKERKRFVEIRNIFQFSSLLTLDFRMGVKLYKLVDKPAVKKMLGPKFYEKKAHLFHHISLINESRILVV
jgi:hypothetical protein